MTNPVWLDSLVEAVSRNWNGEATGPDRALFDQLEVQRLYGGLNNPLYRFRPPGSDGGWCCLKLHLVDDRQRARREWQALRLLSARSQPVVPRPLYYRPSDRHPAVVMEYLGGYALGGRPLAAAELAALRDALHALYTLTPEQTGEPLLEVVTTATGMVERMRGWWATLTHGSLVDDIRSALAKAWHAWTDSPDPRILCAPAPVVFGRGDPNLGNCLWDGQRVALVDFEYAGWTDRAFELGDLVEHPRSRATPDTAWKHFVDGFDLSDEERARYEATRRLLCFFWLARWWPVANQPSTTDRFTAQVDRAEQLLARFL